MEEFNCCPDNAEPDWSKYDGLEVSYVKNTDMLDGSTCCEVVALEEDASMITMYGHMPSGEVEALHDFDLSDGLCNVVIMAIKLIENNHSLRKHGVLLG